MAEIDELRLAKSVEAEKCQARVYEYRGLISPTVCRSYIERSQQARWFKSNISELNPSYSREQSPINIDTNALFAAVRPLAPPVIDDLEIETLVKVRTVCMRYLPGNHFGPHTDTPFRDQNGNVTKLSLVLYLNDDYSGGETSFPGIPLDVKPEVGKILLFAPDLLHLSKAILSGVKYIIRSEILYRPQ
jgi:hypothetical protein